MSAKYHSRRILSDALVLIYGGIGHVVDAIHNLERKANNWIDVADKAAIQAAYDAKQARLEKHSAALGDAGDLHEKAMRQARRMEEAAKALRETAKDEFNNAIDTFGQAVDRAHEFLDDAITYHQ